MILEAMLQRLYQSLLKGPSLNARPNHSRQRIDVMELAEMSGGSAATFVKRLLADGKVEIHASAERFKRPEYPEAEWSDEEKKTRDAWEKQGRLLRKLAGIAADAKEYSDDHGEDALFVGYPILSLPPKDDREGFGSTRVLAPLGMIPIQLTVRAGAKAGITVETAEEGSERLVANPALLAWIEKVTGASSEEILADDSGDEPWQELREILGYVAKGVGITGFEIDPETALVKLPDTKALPEVPAILTSAVLGLFPMTNPGLIRDTQWMIANETGLTGPVRPFLAKEAIYAEEPHALPPAEEIGVEEQARCVRDFGREFLITRADPCQAAAVEEAARAQALVVHGPPGTGKSQTIANIIGDHLARGERVLFVCDKRTALDVVKFRLDALDIGHLCGVIHDPQRDRKDFYMAMRARMEELVEDALPSDAMPALKRVNKRLGALHRELRDAYASLHSEEADGESFHALVGRWLELAAGRWLIEGGELVTGEMVELHRADLTEICERALAADLDKNVLMDSLDCDLESYLSAKPGDPEGRLREFANVLNLPGDGEDLPALPDGDPVRIAEARENMSRWIREIGQAMTGALVRAVLLATDGEGLSREWNDLAKIRDQVMTGLDRELALQVKGVEPVLANINPALIALKEYQEASRKWTKVFAIGKRKAASAVLAALGLRLDPSSLERAVGFHEGLKARIILGDFLANLAGVEGVRDDGAWKDDLTTLDLAMDLARLLRADPILEAAETRRILAESGPGNHADVLATSATRARALGAAMAIARTHGMLRESALSAWDRDLRSGRSGGELGPEIDQSATHLEGVLRLQNCLANIPVALVPAIRSLALQGCDAGDALTALTRISIENRIRGLIAARPELARIDTMRIEAAFRELGERMAEKQILVQRVLIRSWQKRQSERVLASTGSRLSPAGSTLRQRLYVRGKKALRLRQMIAAGNGAEGGDPLFDLCPVWMVSPDTVAQIFPRECLFDVVIFDEASQCRLEEALPVLLRAKRVVVAGDPKQLPPTRFFESAVVDSGNGDFEDEEELHAQQMSEMEDLLGAALNLDVSESFLDVHYRSRNEALIGFSNESFYGRRLQPIPGHPKNKALAAPIRLIHVDGIYKDQTNPAEAMAVVALVAEMLDDAEPPSIGVATFNLKQRNLILEMLDEKAAEDSVFAGRLEEARRRKGRDSFEGLFVKNLENVQGDERDVMIVSTTFGRDETGKFRRNFGALSRIGGERRLNVLVTRARAEIHVLTSIPREEYLAGLGAAMGNPPNGRVHLYSYLCYAERLADLYRSYHDALETMRASDTAECEVLETRQPSRLALAFGEELRKHGVGSTVHWGNNGFSVDVALAHPAMPEDVTIGVLTDFNRYRNTPDPIDWELFRTEIHRAQGWKLERVWSPRLFRDLASEMTKIVGQHRLSVDGGFGSNESSPQPRGSEKPAG